MVRGVFVKVDEDSILRLPLARFYEQCLYSYCEARYDVQKASLLQWKL